MIAVSCEHCGDSHNCHADPGDDRGIRAFLAERTQPNPAARVSSFSLYVRYVNWCSSRGNIAATTKAFAKAMRALGHIHAKHNGRMTYLGLILDGEEHDQS